MLILFAKQVRGDLFSLGHCAFLELEQLCSIVAVFVCLATANKLSEEGESRFLLQACEVLVVFDEDVVLLPCPLLLVNNLFIIDLFIGSKHNLLFAEDNIVIVGTVNLAILLLVRLFVDEAHALHTQRIVAQDLVFYLL